MLGLTLRLVAIALLSLMMMLIKLAGEAGVSLPEILFWRQAFALPAILVGVMLGAGLVSLKTTRIGKHATRSAMGLTGMILNFSAVMLLPLAEATSISFTMPLFATLLSALLLGESVGLHRIAAVVLGFVGTLIVLQPGDGHIPATGAALGLAGAMMVALISVQVRDLTRTEPSLTIVFWFSVLTALPLALLMPWFMTAHDGYVWGLALAIGTAGGVGQICLTCSLRYAPVSTVIGMDYSALIWALLFGWLVWAQLPPQSTWIGAPIIVASGLYIAWREHRLSIDRNREVAA